MSDVIDPNVKGTENKSDEVSAFVTQQDLSRMVNQAITSHLKRLDFDSKITSAIEQSLSSLKENTSKKDSTSVPGSDNSEVAALKKQLEALQTQIKEKDAKAAAQLKASREKDAFSQLRTMLGGKVRPEAVDSVAKLLFHADKKIKVGDEGEMSWLNGDEEISIEDGIKQYLKTKEASMYLPAPTAAKTLKKPGDKSDMLGSLLRKDQNSALPEKGNANDAKAVLAGLGLSLK